MSQPAHHPRPGEHPHPGGRLHHALIDFKSHTVIAAAVGVVVVIVLVIVFYLKKSSKATNSGGPGTNSGGSGTNSGGSGTNSGGSGTNSGGSGTNSGGSGTNSGGNTPSIKDGVLSISYNGGNVCYEVSASNTTFTTADMYASSLVPTASGTPSSNGTPLSALPPGGSIILVGSNPGLAPMQYITGGNLIPPTSVAIIATASTPWTLPQQNYTNVTGLKLSRG